MKVEEIEKLLAEFYEGRTTESQEQELKSYFETQDVPEHLWVDKKLFLSFRPEEIWVPDGLGDKLISIIDAENEKEKNLFIKGNSKSIWRWIGGVAASVVLLIGVSYSIINWSERATPKDTFTNPQEAYAAIQNALIEVSSNLNEGFGQLAEVKREIKDINKEIINEIQ